MLFGKRDPNFRDLDSSVKTWIEESVEQIHTRISGIDPRVIREHAETMKRWLWDIWKNTINHEELVRSGLKHLKWGFDLEQFHKTHIADVLKTLVSKMLEAGLPVEQIIDFTTRLTEAVNIMVKGYLRYPIKTPIEESEKLGEELNRVYEEINNSLTQLHAAYEQIAKASQHIATNVQNLAANSTDSLKIFEKFSNTIKQVLESIERTANNIKGVIAKFNSLSEAFKDISTTVAAVTEYSKKVDKITDIISDIAEQTNLLALNAAIEAARLGEQGRGFAVVADEIRRLADSVKKSADDISTMITNTSQQVTKLGEVTRNAQVLIKEVSDMVLKTTSDLESQAELVKKVAPEEARVKEAYEKMHAQIEEISSATEEQASATEEALSSLETIKEAMENLGKEVNDINKLSTELRNTMRKILTE